MLLARSLLKEGGYFIFDNYFNFTLGYYMDNFHITKRYINGDISTIHGLQENQKISIQDKERYKDKDKLYKLRTNLATENEIYGEMLVQEDKKGSGPFLDYCMSKAKTLAVETGYNTISYLSDDYRLANISKKGYRNDTKCFTLMFEAGVSLIQENLVDYIPDGYYQNDKGYIVELDM
jgi:hypothetical protein